MTPPDLSDEQIERHRECLTIYYSSCCDCGSEQAELEALASANALCDQALRVRALQEQCDRLTGMRFDERMHAALVSRVKEAESRAEALKQERDAWLRSHRWNIREEGDTLIICHGDHEKYEACAETRYVPESRAEASAKDAGRYKYLYENALIPFTYHPAIHELNDRAGWVLREIGVISGKNLGWAETRDAAIDAAIAAKEQPHDA